MTTMDLILLQLPLLWLLTMNSLGLGVFGHFAFRQLLTAQVSFIYSPKNICYFHTVTVNEPEIFHILLGLRG